MCQLADRGSAESGAACVAKQIDLFAKTSNKDILIAWVRLSPTLASFLRPA